MNPFTFGDALEDSQEEMKRGILYLGEGIIFFYAIWTLIAKSSLNGKSQLPDIPFAGELIAALLIFSAAFAGALTHYVARWFSTENVSVYGSIACFLYWVAFGMFVIPPVFAGFFTGGDYVMKALNFSEDMKLFSTMAICVPVLFVYYVGTISSWIGRMHNMEPILGGISILIAYVIYFVGATLVGGAVAFVGKLLGLGG